MVIWIVAAVLIVTGVFGYRHFRLNGDEAVEQRWLEAQALAAVKLSVEERAELKAELDQIYAVCIGMIDKGVSPKSAKKMFRKAAIKSVHNHIKINEVFAS